MNETNYESLMSRRSVQDGKTSKEGTGHRSRISFDIILKCKFCNYDFNDYCVWDEALMSN